MKFTLIFQKDPEEGYVVEVLELPGCLSWGKTIDEAKNNIKEAIQLYLEALKK
jgi:predicted RNase H-like HicB family nuclease